MILLNTCHIREKAAEKVYSELGRLKPLKDRQTRSEDRCGRLRGPGRGRRDHAPSAGMVDLVVGPQSYHRLPELGGQGPRRRKGARHRFPGRGQVRRAKNRPKAKRGPTAFLTVQEGCDKFCAFCVVPYTRGAEVSRPAAVFLTRRAIWLSAACARSRCWARTSTPITARAPMATGHWPADLGELNDIDGLDRIRYTTSHPNDMDRRPDRGPWRGARN